jgi:23S rRNA (adenine-N6)-dimethyltransferase
VAPGELVLDLGAGTGMLTRALLSTGARVIAVELDRGHAARLRRACPEATVLECDLLGITWPREPFRVVANLPFAGASELCRRVLSDPGVPLRSLDAVVAWEAASKWARLWPSTLRSVLWGAWYELRLVRRLAPSAFAPPPSVAAAVIRATRRARPLVPAHDAAAYERFLRAAFGSGSVRRSGASVAARRLAAELAFDRGAHARDLDASQWAALFSEVAAMQESSARGRTVTSMTRRGRAGLGKPTGRRRAR